MVAASRALPSQKKSDRLAKKYLTAVPRLASMHPRPAAGPAVPVCAKDLDLLRIVSVEKN